MTTARHALPQTIDREIATVEGVWYHDNGKAGITADNR